MKTALTAFFVVLAVVGSAAAGFSERKLENAKRSAEKSGKLVAFLFLQEFYLPNCPKCISDVSANNSAAKKALPRSHVVVVEIEPGDKDMDKLPAVVGQGGPRPRVVITDAQCETVVAEYKGRPSREQTKEIEAKVKEARSSGQ